MKQDFVKDMILYLPGPLVAGILNFFLISFLTNRFSSDVYGNYSLVISIIALLNATNGWITMSIIRFYPRYEKENKLSFFYGPIIKLTILSILIISIPSFIIVLLINLFSSLDFYTLLLLGVFFFIVSAIWNVLLCFYRVKRKILSYSLLDVAFNVCSFILGVTLILKFNNSIDSLLISYIIVIMFLSPIAWIVIFSKIELRERISKSNFVEMLKYSLPLVCANVSAWFLTRLDRFIIAIFYGSTDVAIYSVPYTITESIITLIITFFNLAFNPLSLKTWEQQGEAKGKKFLEVGIRYYSILTFPIVLSIIILAAPIILFVSSEEYLAGAIIVAPIALSILLLGFEQVLQTPLQYYKNSKYILLVIITSSCFSCILNLIFIQFYGYFAASLSSLFSYVLMCALMAIGVKKKVKNFFPFRSFLKIILSVCIFGLMLYFLSNLLPFEGLLKMIVSIGISIIVYLWFLILIREVKMEEIKEILYNKT